VVASVSRSRFFRGFLVFLFIGAALLAGLAVSMLVEAATGHGSLAGDILMMGLALMLLVLSAVLIILGIMYWRLSQPSPEDANN